MDKSIEKIAAEFQELSREQKKIDGKMKPLKQKLVDYAKENKADFDEAFQLKFTCGAYISQRVKDCLDGSEEAMKKLADSRPDLVKADLDEEAVLEQAPADNVLRKLLTKLGIVIKQKETFAVYAG